MTRAQKQLVVADDKGLGTHVPARSGGLSGFSTHQDTGTVNLIPLPNANQLARFSKQVFDNNHWNLTTNIEVGPEYIDAHAAPVAVPKHIGEPSLIKYVFLVIKENRTYDQMLGDVPWGDGDPKLAIFASGVPNQHAFVKRFPLLDNVYAPSRQSADGHPWIGMSGSFYSNDILVAGLDSFLSGRRCRGSSDIYSERLSMDRGGSQGTFRQAIRRME